jgi:IS605 OrfB family transposase
MAREELKDMITVECRVEFSSKDMEILKDLMRRWSSCKRYAYQRLLEGEERKELKKRLQAVFGLNSRYVDDAILKAQEVLKACREKGQNPRKVIFGGRGLFEKLRKNHLQGKEREKLKRQWEEKRKCRLYSRGDRSKQGNLNIRLELEEDELYLRVNSGNRKWIKGKVHRRVSREKDRWVDFVWSLLISGKAGEYFPYSVELAIEDNKVYAHISYEEHIPETVLTKDYGVIGIDINASPFNLALAEVGEDGNLVSYQSISLHELTGKGREQREYLAWHIAHGVIELALEKGRAIAIEKLEKVSKGYRGDGKAKLRKRFQQWAYKSILEKIKTLGKRKGIEVIEVSPSYTSIIGSLKYAPIYNMDKDIAGAYVIGRRALGFREDIPENYLKLLSEEEFLFYSLAKLEEKKGELKQRLKEEKNKYKGNAIKGELSKLNKEIKLLRKELESADGEPKTQQPVNQRKEQVRGEAKTSYKLWQVLRVALTLPILGRSFVRDFSPLKSILVDWDRGVKRLAPVLGVGAMASQIPPVSVGLPEVAEYKYTDQKCSFIHFC